MVSFIRANKPEKKKITNPRVVRHFDPTKYCLVADSIEKRIYKDYDEPAVEFPVMLDFFERLLKNLSCFYSKIYSSNSRMFYGVKEGEKKCANNVYAN